ncbi:hypothetical protein KY345_06680 [Candidatus Woesearchaeota archaeon]|nr:hypothetical protein [Candidatus Woesearchaeota archaeon]
MKEKAIERLQKLSGHRFIELTSKGDTAIFAALYCARKIMGLGKVLIPSEGGWLTYPKYPKMLQMDVELVKTVHGKIDLEDLKSKVDEAKIFLYQDYGGYFVKNDVEKIYEICKGKCIVILDITASLGADDFSSFCDIALSSFGRWKPVNLRYGGFLSTNRKIIFEKPKEIFNTTSFDESKYEGLLERLDLLKERQQKIRKECEKIKKELKNFNILHKESPSLVVVVGFKDDSEKEKIIKYCKNNNYEYTICPRYIRVNEDAVSIEVKRLEVN